MGPSIEKVDMIWKELSLGRNALMELGEYPFSPRYGWLNDRYGLSWQIVPTEMNEMMAQGSKEQINRVTQASLKMKKFDPEKLRRA